MATETHCSGWQATKWGRLATLEYGKSIRDYEPNQSAEKPYRVFGTNGPIGWHSSPLYTKPSIVVGRKGAYRGIHFSPDPFFVIDTAFYLKPTTEFDIRWAYFQLKNFDINKLDSGSAIPSTSRDAFYEIPVALPPFPIQQRIAGILSAYDELIENSQRRIKILEAMARGLYREWFVHFRFPGHENHSRVASALGEIPQGWETANLETLIKSHIGGGWGKDEYENGFSESAWVIRGTDIPEARYSQFNGVPLRFHSPSNLRSRRLKAGDIVFEVSGGSKGQPVGRSLLITPELLNGLEGDVICASFCKRIEPDSDQVGSELLYLSFVEGYESGEIEQYQVQSTGISNFKWTDYIANTERAIPPKALQEKFRIQVAPIFKQVATIGLTIQNLRRIRDLLLPRLLSGQINLLENII